MKERRLPQQMMHWLCMLLFLLASGWSNYSYGQATVETDRPDYLPGDLVIITGSGWWAGEEVTLVIQHLIFQGHPDESWNTTASEGGWIFDASYFIDPWDLGETFLLTATGQSSGLVATTTFTDDPALDGDGYLTASPVFVCGAGNYDYTFTFEAGSGNQYATNSVAEIVFPETWTLTTGAGGNVSVTPFSGNQNAINSTSVNGSELTVVFKTANGGGFTVNISSVPMPSDIKYTIPVRTDGDHNGTFVDLASFPYIMSSTDFDGHIVGSVSSCSTISNATLTLVGNTGAIGWWYKKDNITNTWALIPGSSGKQDINLNNISLGVQESYYVQTSGGCNGHTTSDIAVMEVGTSPAIQASDIVSYGNYNPYFGEGQGGNITITSLLAYNVVYSVSGSTISYPYTFAPGTTTVQVLVTNMCGSATTSFTVSTGVPPSFSACPGNITNDTDAGECSAIVNYTATATGTPEPTINYVFTGATSGNGSGTGSGSTFLKGVTTVTLTATNGVSPDATCTFTLTVEDNEAPVLVDIDEDCATLNQSGLNQCLSEAAAFVPETLEEAVAALYKDNCPGDITATYTNTIVPEAPEALNSNCAWTFTYEFTIADVEGNGTTCSVTYSGGDTEAPTLVGTVPSGQTNLNLCFENIPAGPTAEEIAALFTDNCGDVHVVKTGVPTGDDCTWSVTYNYTIVDDCGNYATEIDITFSGGDTEAPTLVGTVPSGQTEMNLCFENIPAGPTALEIAALFTDNCGDVHVVKTGVPTGDDCTWSVTYNYTIEDDCDNFASSINIIYSGGDTEAPTLVGTIPSSQTNLNLCFENIPAGPTAAEIAALFTDNCGDVHVEKSGVPEGDDCVWTVTYNYTIVDDCGNYATEIDITFSGGDTEAPTLVGTVPSGQTEMNLCFENIPAGPTALEIAALFTDNCGDVHVEKSGLPEGDDCVWTVTYNYTIVDDCGNYATEIDIIFSGGDTEAPVITGDYCDATEPIVVQTEPGECDYTAGTEFDITITDNCDDDVSVTWVIADIYNGVPRTRIGTGTSLVGEVFVPGLSTITFTAEDNCENVSTCSFVVEIQITTITTVFTSAEAARYMDEVTLYAEVATNCPGYPLTGNVEFFLDGISVGSAPAYPIPAGEEGYPDKLRASLLYKIGYNAEGTNLNLDIMPKNDYENDPWLVTAEFTASSDFYLDSEDETELFIFPREASPFSATVGFYTGPIFAWTTTPTSSTGTVTLSATIVDTNTPIGDVRGATVTFYWINSDGSKTPVPSAQNLPVGLVDQLDGTVGTVSADVQLNLGNQLSADYAICVEVKGGYENDPDSPNAQSLITIYKQTPGGRINGSAELVNTEYTNGHIKGAISDSTNTKVSFDVTYNKKGRNPQGRVTVIIWSWYDANGLLDNVLHKYIITSNAINATIVNQPETGDGYFSGKANLKEEIDGQTISIQGNSVLQMWLFDDSNNGGPNGLLGVQYDRQEGGIWYSNNWNGYSTETEQIAAAPIGFVKVSGDGSKDIEVTESPEELEAENDGLFTVYPNPTRDNATFRFIPQTDSKARLEIYHLNGSFVQTLFEGDVTAGNLYEFVYQPADRHPGMLLYRLILDHKVINGKLVIQQ